MKNRLRIETTHSDLQEGDIVAISCGGWFDVFAPRCYMDTDGVVVVRYDAELSAEMPDAWQVKNTAYGRGVYGARADVACVVLRAAN